MIRLLALLIAALAAIAAAIWLNTRDLAGPDPAYIPTGI